MRHQKNKKTLDRNRAARKALLSSLIENVVLYEKIKTTEGKARAVRPLLERLITISKRQNLTARRMLIKYLRQEKAVKKLIEELGPRYKDRQGGYTRLIKLGAQQGDGAKIAQLELV